MEDEQGGCSQIDAGEETLLDGIPSEPNRRLLGLEFLGPLSETRPSLPLLVQTYRSYIGPKGLMVYIK